MKHRQEDNRDLFLAFMEKVFVNCGTYTLEDQLRPVYDPSLMQPGDVFIKGGAPGHAEIVADMATDPKTGRKIYLLAEGYMPAQDIHILMNPLKPALGLWYELNDNDKVVTASWVSGKDQLKRW